MHTQKLILLSLLFPCICTSATICTVYRSEKNTVPMEFGSWSKDTLLKLTPKQRFALAGEPGAYDKVEAAVASSANGFSILLFSFDGKAREIGDLGGAVTVQIKQSAKNLPTDPPPVFFKYECNRQTMPPPPDGSAFCHWEADELRKPRTRYLSLAPAYPTRYAPNPKPSVAFAKFAEGWLMRFDFTWAQFFDNLPYAFGEYPKSWRLALAWDRPDGSCVYWGKTDDPVMLSWPRLGDAFTDSIMRQIILDHNFGNFYGKVRSAEEYFWSHYKEEQFANHYVTKKETFEPKNPRSDSVYLANCLTPFIALNATLAKNLAFDPMGERGPRRPPAEAFPRAVFTDMYRNLGRIRYPHEAFGAVRRDYLLAQFINETLPVYVPENPPKSKPAPKRAKTKVPSLDEDEMSDNMIIELDDISF